MAPAALFLLQSVLVIGLPYGLWRLAAVRRLAPLVVVQILAGVALGPSLLGRLAPELWQAVFPPASLRAFDGLVWLGLTFFAFATGLHFDLTELKGRGRAFAATSAASIILPLAAGAGTGLLLLHLAPGAAAPQAPGWAFIAGVAIAVGVTALPVLAAILREMGQIATPLGADALGCAAVNDAILWILVAALLALSGGGESWRMVVILAAAVLFALALWFLVRPGLERLLPERIGERHMVVLAVGVLLAALLSELIGLHAVIGAFAFGAVVPKTVARSVLDRVEPFLMVVILPFFFIATGLKTLFGLDSQTGLIFGITTAAALLSKLAAGAGPSLLFGRTRAHALALGALIGCKGLMELVVLTLLLERGIVSQAGFSGMVLMALATTALARPLAERALR